MHVGLGKDTEKFHGGRQAGIRGHKNRTDFSVSLCALCVEVFFARKGFGGLGSTLTIPISRGRRPRSATPNPQ